MTHDEIVDNELEHECSEAYQQGRNDALDEVVELINKIGHVMTDAEMIISIEGMKKMTKTESTEQALKMIKEIAFHTVDGCVKAMKTLDDMIGDDRYDQTMVVNARALAFERCQELQIKEGQKAWAGELNKEAEV